MKGSRRVGDNEMIEGKVVLCLSTVCREDINVKGASCCRRFFIALDGIVRTVGNKELFPSIYVAGTYDGELAIIGKFGDVARIQSPLHHGHVHFPPLPANVPDS